MAKIQKPGVSAQCYLLSLLFFFALLAFVFAPARADAPSLLEMGSAKRISAPAAPPTELKIVSYNIRWRSGQDLEKITELLRSDPEIGGALIIGLQEVDRNKKRSRNTNTARMMAEDLGMYYAWAAPPNPERSKDEEEETGVAILSPYPMSDARRIVLPNEGPGGRRRVGLGVSVQVGATSIRVYSVHAETRISSGKRVEQLQAILDDLKSYAKADRAVVLGDFNTLWPQDVENISRLFKAANFETPLPDSKTTWKTFILELKLDWIWLKGLPSNGYGINKKIGYSDHWPLWVKVSLRDGVSNQPDIRGRITKIERTGSTNGNTKLLGSVLVEATGETNAKLDKAVVRITTETHIFMRRGAQLRSISFKDLKTGDRIEAHFIGPLMESYPVQATAREITILRQ